MVILVGRGLCCSVKCTGRGSRRKGLVRTKKPRNDECGSPSAKTERRDWLELAWPWRGPSFPAVNFGICWSESPRGISPVRLAAWGAGSGRREPGRPVLSRGHLGPNPATSGQLFARSPASTPECALITRTFFRFRVWALCEGGAVVCGVSNPSPLGHDFSWVFQIWGSRVSNSQPGFTNIALPRAANTSLNLQIPFAFPRVSIVAQLVKNPLQCGIRGFDSWIVKIAWRRERLPTPVFWPREFFRIAKSQTRLSDFHFTSHFQTPASDLSDSQHFLLFACCSAFHVSSVF